ncbi:MAG: NAD(P)H-binding protein, partial [Saprospiraceae bacterium]
MEIIKGDKTALVFGATGLIGSHLVEQLLRHNSYQKVKVFVRREMKIKHPKLVQHIIDFDKLLDYADLIEGDDLFCALGTTRAKAGSKEAFFKVDFTYVYEAARIGLSQGINQFLLVSSVGADPSSFFYYSQVKGEIEKAVKDLDYWGVHIFQPSLLLGERNENRFGEDVAKRIGKVFDKIT